MFLMWKLEMQKIYMMCHFGKCALTLSDGQTNFSGKFVNLLSCSSVEGTWIEFNFCRCNLILAGSSCSAILWKFGTKLHSIWGWVPRPFIRKFTDDGQYLISFSRNHQELIVYRPRWLSFSCKDEDCDKHDLPSRAKRFDSFFTQLYCVALASCNELICKDFFLYMESNQFGLFSTSTAQIHDAPAVGGAVHGVPSIEKITFLLLRCLFIFLYIWFFFKSSK